VTVRADPRAEAALDAHLAYLRALVTAGGGDVLEDSGTFVYRSTAPYPFLVNGAARTDPAVPGADVVRKAREAFGERGFELLCLDGRDEDLRAAATEAGLTVAGTDPLQHLDGPPIAGAPTPPGISIRPVTDVAGVRDVITVNTDAVSVYGFPAGFFDAIFATPETILDPRIEAAVAYEEGEPLATAQVFLHGTLAYVGWVAVARRAGRRGLGRLVTEDVVQRGLARGASAAVLMASPMGAPLYRRMGFVDVGQLRNAAAAPA
jgi:ribosomal protein S18 acetylase RimI-like enzyme